MDRASAVCRVPDEISLFRKTLLKFDSRARTDSRVAHAATKPTGSPAEDEDYHYEAEGYKISKFFDAR